MLVEDNLGDAFLIEANLKEAIETEFQVIHVEYLAEAISCLNEKSFDAILLDPILPDSQGIDTLLSIIATAPQLPIIVLTGMNYEKIAIEAVKQGARDYLLKCKVVAPFAPEMDREGLGREENRMEGPLVI